MSNKITQLQTIIDAVSLNGGNKAAAALDLGMAISTLKDWYNLALEAGLSPTVYPADIENKISLLKQEYEDKLTAFRRQIREDNRSELTAEYIRSFLWGLSSHSPTPPKWTNTTRVSHSGPGTPTLLLSDFHWGENVRPEQVGNINKFDLKVAHDRLNTTINSTIDLAFNHMVSPKYPGLILCLGGDMFSGEIHEELTASNELRTSQLLFDMLDEMISAINELAKHFGKVHIVTAFGNHGRMLMKPGYKDAAFTNFDWILYNMLEHHYKAISDDRMTFQISSAFDQQFEVEGIQYLLTHGDRLGAGGGGGLVGMAGPIIRGFKKVKAQYAQMGRHIDFVLCGHFHQLLWLQDGICNGSLKGYDEFAIGHRFEPEAPQQALWFTHRDKGMTFRIPVFSEGTGKLTFVE